MSYLPNVIIVVCVILMFLTGIAIGFLVGNNLEHFSSLRWELTPAHETYQIRVGKDVNLSTDATQVKISQRANIMQYTLPGALIGCRRIDNVSTCVVEKGNKRYSLKHETLSLLRCEDTYCIFRTRGGEAELEIRQ